MANLTWVRVLSSGVIGFVAWQGALWAIPFSILMPFFAAIQPSRAAAGATSFAYYAAASLPVIRVAGSYWPSLGIRALLIWLTAAAILSLPWILCWTCRESLRHWATAVAVGLSTVPPLCIVGWASPLVSAGVLFPNSAWLGVIATLALPGLLLHKRTRTITVLTAGSVVLFLDAVAKPLKNPTGWEAIATCIHRQKIADDMAEFSIEERLQAQAVSSEREFLVYPEGAV